MSRFEALAYVVIRVSSAFIFQTFAEVCYSVFVKRNLNSDVKVSFFDDWMLLKHNGENYPKKCF